jgi:hypothetical protein
VLDTSRQLLRAALWGRGGTSRERDAPVADPALIRRLDIGQAAYIYRGGVTFVQVKRLTAAPPALPREPMAPGEPSATPTATRPAARPASREPRTALPPDAGSLLDEAFGRKSAEPASARSQTAWQP